MIKYCLLLIVFFFSGCFFAYAQPALKAANDAFVITRMAAKFHVQPRTLDKNFSDDLYNSIFKELDGDKLFFTKDDISKLEPYRFALDEEIREKKSDFLQLLISVYQQRILQADTMIENICKKPFNFSLPEKLTMQEDTSWPENVTAMKMKLYKQLKLFVLKKLLDARQEDSTQIISLHKNYPDSLEFIFRKKAQKIFQRSINVLLQSPGGLQQEICNIYCQQIALCYDPHTEYFPPTEKENFESELGNKSYEFGFNIDEDNDDAPVIENLKPGSPAFKSGQLNKGDKILSVQWEGEKAIDVSDASPEELGSILGENNHTRLTLVVKKEDNSTRQVTLLKEKEEEDDNKVKSFLLKGDKTIGYISLPDFYSNWEDENKDDNGCANDVAKEIIKLKQENISGLILDLRYNGGGSMQEAVELSGIFIDAGPVEQIKEKDNKIFTLKDVNRGTIYDGPLLILVNGYSASASEMFAGTLQDYNRALIVGSPTYGKATAQIVLPMDTTINIETNDGSKEEASSYLKVTVSKLYRITGATAQRQGVQPDILLPDILEADPHREADDSLSLVVSPADANKYYKPCSPLPVSSLQSTANTLIANESYFKSLHQYINYYKANNQSKNISLKWEEALAEQSEEEKLLPDLKEARDSITVNFIIDNNSYEKQLLLSDEDLKQVNDENKIFLSHDPYIKIAYNLLLAMQK